MTTLGGVHHVSLNVTDAEEAGRFYEDVLGLTRIPRPDFGIPGIWLSAGEVQIHLIEVPDHRAPDGQHFAFRVDDLDATREDLLARGVEVGEPSSFAGFRQAFLTDPSGNLIELNQPDPAA